MKVIYDVYHPPTHTLLACGVSRGEALLTLAIVPLNPAEIVVFGYDPDTYDVVEEFYADSVQQ